MNEMQIRPLAVFKVLETLGELRSSNSPYVTNPSSGFIYTLKGNPQDFVSMIDAIFVFACFIVDHCISNTDKYLLELYKNPIIRNDMWKDLIVPPESRMYEIIGRTHPDNPKKLLSSLALNAVVEQKKGSSVFMMIDQLFKLAIPNYRHSELNFEMEVCIAHYTIKDRFYNLPTI